MKAYERAAPTREDHPHGWRISGQSSGLGAGAWAMAVVVVALLTLGLYLLHG